MASILPSLIAVGAFSGWFCWRLLKSTAMRECLRRAVFKVGYLLYANTRCGRWMHERQIRKAMIKHGEDGHSEVAPYEFGNLQIWPLPCVFDNYAYVVKDKQTSDVVVIDAGDGMTVFQFLEKHSMVPKAILTTHRHWDHCGGNELLKKRFSSMVVYGSAIDKPHSVTQSVTHEQNINVGSLEFTAYLTPGHTRGHMVYLMKGESYDATSDCLFTGDLLFLGGCGHEYAVPDLLFSVMVDSANTVVQEKLTWAQEQRQQRLPTCPSTLEEEKQYNLFLRTGDVNLLKRLGLIPPEVRTSAGGDDEGTPLVITHEQRVRALIELRERKDRMQ